MFELHCNIPILHIGFKGEFLLADIAQGLRRSIQTLTLHQINNLEIDFGESGYADPTIWWVIFDLICQIPIDCECNFIITNTNLKDKYNELNLYNINILTESSYVEEEIRQAA